MKQRGIFFAIALACAFWLFSHANQSFASSSSRFFKE
jgi:hypothetical protein